MEFKGLNSDGVAHWLGQALGKGLEETLQRPLSLYEHHAWLVLQVIIPEALG